MKICILTLPLHNNYGGLLQAYALQTVLKRKGHEVWTENRKANVLSLVDKLKRNNLLRKFVGKEKLIIPTSKEEEILSQNTSDFIYNNIRTTVPINNTVKKELKGYGFEVYIVGSDQVWRPYYSSGIYNYFLDFTRGQNVKRVVYAASFGVENWEYTKKQTTKCALLAKDFDAISVREDSAVDLCNKYLGVSADHVLDPTMLLSKEDYIKLVLKDNTSQSQGNLFTYLLDHSEKKQEIVDKVKTNLGLQSFEIMPKFKYSEVACVDINSCIFPSVTEWIRGFWDAEYIVTDSFHGCVFSIIFEKPFIAIVNEERGATRFTSLLKIFGLSNRLVNSLTEVTDELLNSSIDWQAVSMILNCKVNESNLFLENSLNGR